MLTHRPDCDRFNDHIVGLRRSHAKLIHHDRLDVLPIDLHHRHLEPRNAHVVEGHGTSVDET